MIHVVVYKLTITVMAVWGCSKRSRQDKDVSFFRIPKVVTNKSKAKEELSRRRRAGFLLAVKRDDLTEKVLSNDRIFSRHFLSGKPADLLDENNPDWLPTLNLGHRNSLSESTARAAEERWDRKKEREARRNTEVVSDSKNTESAEVVSESQACAGVQTSLTSKSIDECGLLSRKDTFLDRRQVERYASIY